MIPWLTAIPADLGFAVAAVGISAGRLSSAPDVAMPLQLGLFAGYLAMFSGRTLRQRKEVGVFEVVQTLLAGLAGLGGALRVSQLSDLGALVPGATALALGMAAYGVAFCAPPAPIAAGTFSSTRLWAWPWSRWAAWPSSSPHRRRWSGAFSASSAPS